MKRLINIIALTFISTFLVQAATVDTISVFSEKMQRSIKNVIILPDKYDVETPLPVVYLLHGHDGDYSTWVNRTKKTLPQDADKLNMIVVCPDGQDSWYWDSPQDAKFQFETYVSQELVKYVDDNYNTRKEREGRAITGFSMGGHGALWLAINHSDVFGACGSMSGGLDLRPFPKSWNLKQHLGTIDENKERWDKHTVMTKMDELQSANLSIIIDCGVDDFFFDVNEKFHTELLKRKVPHDYIVRPGQHSHVYWNNAIDYQLLFFNKFFETVN